jgi:outer membrane lipoprotein-sorting protein
MVPKIKILVCLLALSIAWANVCTAGSLEEIRSAAEQISSIKGDFIQEKQMAILAHPIIARGYFAYQRPASLRWEYRQPLHSVLLLHNGKAHRFVQSDSGWIEDKAANTQSMDFMLQEIAKWLNGRFDDNPMFRVSVEDGNRIIMTPKDKSMDQFIQRIELIMADQPGIMKEVVIYESTDSFTRFIFIDPKINEPIAPAEFQKVQ